MPLNFFNGETFETLYAITDQEDDLTRETVTGYNIYRGLASGGAYDLIDMVDGNTTSYLDESAENFTTYYYVVTAMWDEVLESEYSNEASATPEPYEALPPEDLTAEAGDAQVTLTWSASDPGNDGGGGTDGVGESCEGCDSPSNNCMYDCQLQCVDADVLLSWIGDGFCDDNTWGMYLDCPEFDCDGGDCPDLNCDGGDSGGGGGGGGGTEACESCEFDFTAYG